MPSVGPFETLDKDRLSSTENCTEHIERPKAKSRFAVPRIELGAQ